MKILVTTAAVATLLANLPSSYACDRQAEIQNVVLNAGPVLVAVYTNESNFRKAAVASFRFNSDNSTIHLPLCDFLNNELALVAYQDQNENNRLDTNLLGIPSEPWGTSGKGTRLGPPTWETSRVGSEISAVSVTLSR
jgi:uncharacterized protein (DUF2141 family)